jgi:nitroreductase
MSSDLYEAIFRRRDVRAEFTGEPVSDQTLQRILTAAHAAPSVGHSQPWDFILVRDEETRRRFHEHVLHEREVFASTLDGERHQTFSRIKVGGIMESTLGIVVTSTAGVAARQCSVDMRSLMLGFTRPVCPYRICGWQQRRKVSGWGGFPSTVSTSCRMS